ncbi:MAG: MATE family efflux transporter [Fusobacterium sp. JB019]|nr:MATE family efflux transporter [Fusobacterium sp. JB019]
MNSDNNNILGKNRISLLLLKFSIPAIIALVTTAVYNIVDQIFIGHSVGFLGNAATNITFPIISICTSIILLTGIGTSACFSIALGEKNIEKAKQIIENGLILNIFLSLAFTIVLLLNVEKILLIFGATKEIMPYALTYTKITALGIPFFILFSAATFWIRADGSPKFAMIITLVGGITNIILDPLFIFKFNMGIAGAAWATIIGQFLSCLLAVFYLVKKFKSFKLNFYPFIFPRLKIFKHICLLGMSQSINQLGLMLVQISMNNVLTYYGARSIYGAEIPLACVGIILKINILFLYIIIGISQGAQPILGYNIGSKQYDRVIKTIKLALKYDSFVSITAFILFQTFPKEIISIFGKGSSEYFMFAEKFFRIFMFFTFANFIQIFSGNFFSAIGKGKIGLFIAITRQFLFLLPLIILLPMLFGIEGVFFSAPISDLLALTVTIFFLRKEYRIIKTLEIEQKKGLNI